jgi:hypothetical protein
MFAVRIFESARQTKLFVMCRCATHGKAKLLPCAHTSPHGYFSLAQLTAPTHSTPSIVSCRSAI